MRVNGRYSTTRSKGLDPVQASNPSIDDFLLYLFKQKGLSPTTIEGYRTAIAGPIKYATGVDLGTHRVFYKLKI